MLIPFLLGAVGDTLAGEVLYEMPVPRSGCLAVCDLPFYKGTLCACSLARWQCRMVVDGNHRHTVFSISCFQGPLARSILVSHSAMRVTHVCNLVFTVKKARTVWATTGKKTHKSRTDGK